MIYLFSLISGCINGLFASGAGQLLVFVLVYILKTETHTARATSIFLIGSVTVVTFIRYITFVSLKINDVITVIISGIIFGIVGSKIMKKIPNEYLNLISGIIITAFAMFSIIRGH